MYFIERGDGESEPQAFGRWPRRRLTVYASGRAQRTSPWGVFHQQTLLRSPLGQDLCQQGREDTAGSLVLRMSRSLQQVRGGGSGEGWGRWCERTSLALLRLFNGSVGRYIMEGNKRDRMRD